MNATLTASLQSVETQLNQKRGLKDERRSSENLHSKCPTTIYHSLLFNKRSRCGLIHRLKAKQSKAIGTAPKIINHVRTRPYTKFELFHVQTALRIIEFLIMFIYRRHLGDGERANQAISRLSRRNRDSRWINTLSKGRNDFSVPDSEIRGRKGRPRRNELFKWISSKHAIIRPYTGLPFFSISTRG